MAEKASLRKEYQEKRMSLSLEELKVLNHAIYTQFKTYPFTGIRFLHFFLPIKKFREVNTLPLIQWVQKEHPQITIVLSKSNLQTQLMEHISWDGADNLITNRWGIPEPSSGTRVLPQQIDAVILPLLAFDKSGNRVGFGKGFYDRFLADCRKDCQKIGLSFYPPVNRITDTNAHDQALTACITTEKTYFF